MIIYNTHMARCALAFKLLGSIMYRGHVLIPVLIGAWHETDVEEWRSGGVCVDPQVCKSLQEVRNQ